MNTTSVSLYILWKCGKYNDEFGISNGLYLLLQCHMEEKHCNHFSLATVISNNPYWQRKCKCQGISRVNMSAAMVIS